jgi:WD40 repeat protein
MPSYVRAGRRARLAAVLLILAAAAAAPSVWAQKRVYARVEPNPTDATDKLTFDVNVDATDNIAPNIVLTTDGKRGFVSYTGSGTVVAFSMETGEILARIKTGGKPAFATLLPDKRSLLVVSVVDNKIFKIDMDAMSLATTYTFTGAQFGFGSIVAISPDGALGFISSTGSGEVIKFALADGKETGRIKGLEGPTQITVTLDGTTLLVVDTLTEEVALIEASSMTRKNTMKAKDKDATANFTIFNNVVLSPDGTTALIGSRNVNVLLAGDTAFYYKTSKGEIIDTAPTGSEPGYTTLTPDKQYWVIYCELSLTLISTTDIKNVRDLGTPQGAPLGSANVVFSKDSRFAFYASAEADQVFQHDLVTGAVVGQLRVGDSPNPALDQPSTLAMAPDGTSIAVLDFISNNIELLTDAYVMDGAKLISSVDKFTGLSLINLENAYTTFTIIALNNFGEVITSEGLQNPVDIGLPPNNQTVVTIGDLMKFNNADEMIGWLAIFSDRPKVAGYVAYGDTSVRSLDGAPLFRGPLFDFIAPEVVAPPGGSVELNFVNPYYNQGSYDANRYLADGTLDTTVAANTAYPTNRQPQTFTDVFSPPPLARVFVAGGDNGTESSNSSENWDLATASWVTNDSPMSEPRTLHTATLLRNGRVLVAGGQNQGQALATANLWDPPSTGTGPTASLVQARYGHTATLLPTADVLLAGGSSGTAVRDTAELYDPVARIFRLSPARLLVPRQYHTATLLPNGKVLITGGRTPSVTATAELYDYVTGRFTATGSMNVPRVFHTATLLEDGRVLITGGNDGTTTLSSVEIYDPAVGGFNLLTSGLVGPRESHTATLMGTGKVLIAGGRVGFDVLNTAELYDPADDSFTATSSTMTAFRYLHTATLLPDDRVLLVGGSDGPSVLNSAETFDAIGGTFAATFSPLGTVRQGHTAVLVQQQDAGYLRLSTTMGLLLTEIVGGRRAISVLNAIDMSKSVGVTNIYSPQFSALPGFNTVLNLINGSPEDAEITLILHTADGGEVARLKQLIAHNGQLKGDLLALFDEIADVRNTSGWLEVRSSNDQIAGTITFTDNEGNFRTTFELRGRPETAFLFPNITEDATYTTGVALLNATDSTATATLELWGPGGTIDRSATITLPPGTSVARYLGGLFPDLEPRQAGNIRIHSTQPLYGLALISDRALGFAAAVPSVPLP